VVIAEMYVAKDNHVVQMDKAVTHAWLKVHVKKTGLKIKPVFFFNLEFFLFFVGYPSVTNK